ncbi:MAG: hypothetical protein ACIAQU_12950 [Phycisphaerales bacterium JB064]
MLMAEDLMRPGRIKEYMLEPVPVALTSTRDESGRLIYCQRTADPSRVWRHSCIPLGILLILSVVGMFVPSMNLYSVPLAMAFAIVMLIALCAAWGETHTPTLHSELRIDPVAKTIVISDRDRRDPVGYTEASLSAARCEISRAVMYPPSGFGIYRGYTAVVRMKGLWFSVAVVKDEAEARRCAAALAEFMSVTDRTENTIKGFAPIRLSRRQAN